MITNTWNDVLGLKGETLKIGANFLPIRGKTCKQFINTCNDAAYPSPLEVKTALSLLLQLTLENHKNADKVTDSLMLRKCESSKIDESRNNLGSTCKYGTKAFIEPYINYLTFNITFNDFMLHKKAGKPSEDATSNLEHNHRILAYHLKKMNPKRFNKIFANKPLVGCFDVVKTLKLRSNLWDKFNNGIHTAHDGPGKNLLWIHQLFILQKVHPRIQKYLQENDIDMSNDSNLDDFISFEKHECITVAVWKGSKIGVATTATPCWDFMADS
jgi:hypothetical protein